MTRQIIFYSWQSDRPNSTNGGLIQTALERAASAIRNDESLQVEPVIERDTAGVAGSPDIAATIFTKIDSCHVFVADVTLVTTDGGGRACPNPNVLLELGYAVRALGWNRVVMVMNRDFGAPEQLPFDLRMRRVLSYSASPDDEAKRRDARDGLRAALERSLRDIIEHHVAPSMGETIKPVTRADAAVEGIRERLPDREARVRRFADHFVGELDAIAPDLVSAEWRDDDLVNALEHTLPYVREFLTVAREAADSKDPEAAEQLHRAVELLAERTRLPKGFSGTFYESQFDYWRFLANEVFVSLVAVFVATDQLQVALDIIQAPIVIPNLDGAQGVLEIQELCRPVRTLLERNRSKKLNRISIQADLLAERRKAAPDALTVEQYRDGDLFIFFATDLRPDERDRFFEWRPYSVMLGDGAPRFLVSTVKRSRAERLATLLGLTVPDLISRIRERIPKTVEIYGEGRFYLSHPLGNFDVGTIGSR